MKRRAGRFLTAVLCCVLALPLAGVVERPAEVPAAAQQMPQVLVSGQPFGLKLFTDGVVVVGTAQVTTQAGLLDPAGEAGIQVGDVIEAVDGTEVSSNSEIAACIEHSGGAALSLSVRRGEQALSLSLTPVASGGVWRAGLWVRDSAAGVGTLTFYDPQTGGFAGLGHGVTDPDTGALVPLGEGDIVPVTVHGFQKGVSGTPGELHGYFSSDTPLGDLLANTAQGVYGTAAAPLSGTQMEVCPAADVHTGPVQILCTLEGSEPAFYDARIDLVDLYSAESRNLVLRITDEKLLKEAGGILQGMSGSPIVQDGRLVGAVTHVFVSDPKRGYGILAAYMVKNEMALTHPAAA